MTELLGKRALVTGGSRGIGAAVAIALADKGADVGISFERAADRAAEVVSAIEDWGQRGFAIQANSADPAANGRLVAEAVAELGGLDTLVNNAGTIRPGNIADLGEEDVDTLLHVNVRGTVLTTKAAIGHLVEGGRIVTIGSTHGERVPFGGVTLYALTKSAHHSFSRDFAQELGPAGITVNLMRPGPIDTEMNTDHGDKAAHIRRLTALGRYGTPRELAAVVAFLAGPGFAFMTGLIVPVDGGLNA
jgi:NAD(P)-dependent dehydrogenase (short-subunit alcohol dehydrogenase family)